MRAVRCIDRRILWAAILLVAAAPAMALEPEEIALVVNARVPEGRKLAEFYASQRHVPDGRIIELELDPASATGPLEEIPFADYDARILHPVRDFLLQHHLEAEVKCLVTFWGVPLRIGRRVLTQAEAAEFRTLDRELADAKAQIAQQVTGLERSALQIAPSYTPPSFANPSADDLEQLVLRMRTATTAIMQVLPTVPDAAARHDRFLQSIAVVEQLIGSAQTKVGMADPVVAKVAPHPLTPAELADAKQQLSQAQREIVEAQGTEPTAAGREKAAGLARKSLGLFGYVSLLTAQRNSLQTDQTESAVDSELALIWLGGYPRAGKADNALYWRAQQVIRQRHLPVAPTVMVCRLDGPSEQTVRDLIVTSLRVEDQGLDGKVVLDARGRSGDDAYGHYDQSIRNLAMLLKRKTKLDVTLENTEALIPAHSMDHIALYCGWYSLRSYVPPGTFNPGAVGFHIASLELVSLRGPNEHGWVHGLLSDGVAATVGPVAEPYLQSFPRADEFFPLLLTGRLTLAEVYWRTEPWASWMQDCIGDPLYKPYKRHPLLVPGDLPLPLRVAFEPPVTLHQGATQPTTQPRPDAK